MDPEIALHTIKGTVSSLRRHGRDIAFTYHKLANRRIIRENTRNGICAVDICNHHGIGAKLVWALEIMAHCDEMDLTPMFRFSYKMDNQNRDFFGSFFETTGRPQKKVKFAKVRNVDDLGLKKYYGSHLTLAKADQLLKKYLVVRHEIGMEVDNFCTEHFKGLPVLGVHYRGTDKRSEAPLIPYEQVKRNIDFYLQQFPETVAIFVSSDDENFIRYAKAQQMKRPIIIRNDTFRSSTANAIHHSQQPKSEINHDAIINCLLLSRCTALLKTASILSAWSKLFNPALPLVMLSEPFAHCCYFPERALAK